MALRRCRNAELLRQALYQHMMLLCIRCKPRVGDETLNGAHCQIGWHICMNKFEA